MNGIDTICYELPMRERGDTTRYGFPPLLDQHLPERVPWDTGIAHLSGLSIAVKCPEHGLVILPLRLLAAQLGHERTLRSIVPRLRCKQCGTPPATAHLQRSNDTGATADHRARQLDLLGPET